MTTHFHPITLTDVAPADVRVKTQPFSHPQSECTAITRVQFGPEFGHAVVEVQPDGDDARTQLMNVITLGRHIVEQAAALLAELEPANDPEADLAEVAAALDADIDEMPPLDVLDPVREDVPERVEGDEVAA